MSVPVNNTYDQVHIYNSVAWNQWVLVIPRSAAESPVNWDIQGDAATFAEVFDVAAKYVEEHSAVDSISELDKYA